MCNYLLHGGDANWYPFSHNHGSVENHLKWKETNIGDTPLFRFHDYGRKGRMKNIHHFFKQKKVNFFWRLRLAIGLKICHFLGGERFVGSILGCPPLPRMPVTTRFMDIIKIGGSRFLNLHLPRLHPGRGGFPTQKSSTNRACRSVILKASRGLKHQIKGILAGPPPKLPPPRIRGK